MKKSFHLIIICVFFLNKPVKAEESGGELVVGTYAYKGLERSKAVQPIADALSNVTGRTTSVKVYDSPTQLAEAFFSGTTQMIVPNLAGFAQIAAKQKNHVLLFVPDDSNSSYKSSVVQSAGNASFQERLKRDTQNIGMVWADSTSGAILGKAWLETQQSGLDGLDSRRITYLGSHQNVLAALTSGEIDIGVLATDVYLNGESKLPEVWRSDVIPFGPALCSRTIVKTCLKLQRYTMENEDVSRKILDNLIAGWPEFRSSKALKIPEFNDYKTFVAHFESSSQ